MKNNKKPSIYSDRGSIGSAEELDEYGVWVKSEPQVLSSTGDLNDAAAIEEAPDMSVSDDAFSIDDAVLDAGAESEASLDDNVDFPDSIDDIGIDEIDEMSAPQSELEDFEISDTGADLGITGEESAGGIEIEDTVFDDLDASDPLTGDDDSENTNPGDLSLDNEIEIDDDLDVDFGTAEEADDDSGVSVPETKRNDIDDINEMLNIEAASMYDTEGDTRTDDDFIFKGSDDLSIDAPEDDFSTDASGSDLSSDLSDDSVDIGDISIDDDISIDASADDVVPEDASGSDTTLETEEISLDILEDDDISIDISDDDDTIPGDSGGDITLETESDANDDFDIPTVKAIENNITSAQDDFSGAVSGKENELSSHLLMKIANELSSIRGELTELKREFSLVRSGVVLKDEKQDETPDGFFPDEDDETIALTGDELDNIINTSEQIT